mgnify:CR=1 FL=1
MLYPLVEPCRSPLRACTPIKLALRIILEVDGIEQHESEDEQYSKNPKEDEPSARQDAKQHEDAEEANHRLGRVACRSAREVSTALAHSV